MLLESVVCYQSLSCATKVCPVLIDAVKHVGIVGAMLALSEDFDRQQPAHVTFIQVVH